MTEPVQALEESGLVAVQETFVEPGLVVSRLAPATVGVAADTG